MRAPARAFLVKREENDSRIEVAPFHGSEVVPTESWKDVTPSTGEDKPRWAADGRIVYYTSEQDGFRCVWGRRFDLDAGTPVGEPFAVYHSYRARRSMKDMPLAP